MMMDSEKVIEDQLMENETGNYVGMPAGMHLEEFGSHVWSVFGDPPFLCGSATQKKDWRDVDVRVILTDEEYAAWGFGEPREAHQNSKWVALCMAFSALAKQMTGLPVDFQIQQMTNANERYKGTRFALGLVPHRYRSNDEE